MGMETSATDHKVMRDINQNRLLNLIRVNGPVSRPELSAITGLSPATVLALTNDLISRQIVIEKGTANAPRGRRPVLLEIDPRGGYAVGLMIREHETVGVIVNLHGSVVSSLHWDLTLINQDAQQTIELIAERVEELITRAGFARERIIGVGCAISGFIDSQNGICVDSWQLGWHNFELGRPLSARLQMPVLVSNNVSCISCYENLFGRGQPYQNFLTVAIGRGLGLGIIINGELYSGATGGAGEFGHTTVVVDGRECECGKRGCLEAYVAHRGLVATYAFLLKARGYQQEEPALEQLLHSAPDDPVACQAFQQAGHMFGIGLANVVNLFNPECIILTGEGIEFGDRFFDPALQALHEHTFSRLGRSLEVLREPWAGYESWARGAGALVLSRFLFAQL